MVAASFAWPEIPRPAFVPACDPPRLSEILPALMQRYGLETRAMGSRDDARNPSTGDETRSGRPELTRERATINSSPIG